MARFLFTRLVPDEPTGHPWIGNDESRREHKGFIKQSDSPAGVNLSWKSAPDAEPRHIGSFLLDMGELLKGRYIKTFHYHGQDGFLLRFVHSLDDCIYIQRDRRSPRLLMGRPEMDSR